MIEFAFLLPILLLLFLGMFEITRLMLVHQKLDKTVYTITDIVTQNTEITNDQLNLMFSEANEIMSPLSLTAGTDDIIISAVTVDVAKNTNMVWQRSLSGTHNCDACGGNPPIGPLPAVITDRLTPGQVVIVGVVDYKFSSVTQFLETMSFKILGGKSIKIDNSDLRKVAIMKPRLGALTSAPK